MPHEHHHPGGEATAGDLLTVVRSLAAELHPRRSPVPVSLDSSLERELGFDSLARVELLTRLEQRFGTRLPETLLASAETPRDLMRALAVGTRHAAAPADTAVRATSVAGTVTAPVHAQTLFETLAWHAQAAPHRPHIYLTQDEAAEEVITYSALLAESQTIAAGLRDLDLGPGQTVAIMLPTGREYFTSFFGVLLAGGIPVPIYPPLRPAQIEEHLRRHARILDNALAAVLITVAEARPLARLLRAQVTRLRSVVTPAELIERAAGSGLTAPPALDAQDIAFLQYTSGSTGLPKGVILTHANLLANIRAMGAVIRASSADVFVSWMPLYHDMGLIGAWLGSLYYGMPLVVMSPLRFLARPERWLWAIHRHRATLSGAPNFGYELCLKRTDDSAIQGLDLSSWRYAFNGAEPVSPDTLARFAARFARHGFRPEAMAPVFGLAESSVGLAFPPPGRAPIVDRIERETFMRDGRAVPAANEDATALRFVACGQPLPGHQIRIVDATGYEVAEREQGRLEFRGPSATSGYFRNPEETRRLFHDDWLDSGDLAYIAEGDVYLTGRVKDLIIRAGRNVYPHELEEVIGNLAGIRKGCVAVFGSIDPASGTERLVVLAETRATDTPTHERLRYTINTLTADLIGMPPDDVVLAPPHTVLKTSSGKIRRAASRERYERGDIGQQPKQVWWQLARLAWSALRPEFHRLRLTGAGVLYAVYAWLLFWLLAPLVWTVVALVPSPAWNRRLIRTAARLLIKLSGTSLMLRGAEHLPRASPCIIVANHASYIDGIVLSAILPGAYSYVAMRELTGQFITRRFLTHIGAEFVERFERQRSVADARELAQAAHAGCTLVFFPEGGFERAPGLAPFHLGAFFAAAEAKLPVVPIALRGTRSILRADQWFPRRGRIVVTVGGPILSPGMGFEAALGLRDTARAQILAHCGEPDLAAASAPASIP
ncbi:MAG: AMP-binding protein [Gammaproteobacteria bacterium]|nr:AMP-binding protein [Gammaproteobacteria bacterium]